MNKRKEKDLNSLFEKYGFNPEGKAINDTSNNVSEFPEDKRNKKSSLDVDKPKNNRENKRKLSLDELRARELSFVEESEIKSDEPIYYDRSSGRHYKYIDKLNLKLAEDKNNLLNEEENVLKILNSLNSLFWIVLEDDFNYLNSKIIESIRLLSISKTIIEKEKLKAEIKYHSSYLITKTARIINEFIYQDQYYLEDFKKLLHNNLTIKIKPDKGINLTDISLILEDISRIFPEIKIPKKRKVRPKNKAYKLNNNEWAPNSAQSNDILSSISKIHLWTEEKDKFQCVITHPRQRGYGQLSLFKFDSTGDLVINDSFSVEDVLNGFDLRDRKILRLLMIEAVQHKGEPFTISGKWILKLIGDDRSSVRVEGRRLTALEKLQDLQRRLWVYDSIIFHWSCKVGKKEFRNLPDGFPIEGSCKVFSVTGVSINKKGKGYELTAKIIPSDWFEFNQKTLQQFTKIPKQLLAIDIYKYPRAYLIGERICELFRYNKQKFLKKGNTYQVPLTITIKSLLDEIITPTDLDKSLNDSKKGHRLKQRIFEEINYLASLLSWQFDWRGVKEGDNFNIFYNSVSFSVILERKLESEILGEKIIETEVKNNSKSIYLDGEQIKALRKKLKMSQKSFGEILGYSKSHISKIECGHEIASQNFLNGLFSKFSGELKNMGLLL